VSGRPGPRGGSWGRLHAALRAGLRAASGARPGRPARARPDYAAAASTVERLAVLLDAGIAPPAAWRHAAGSGGAVAARVAAGGPAGHELADRIAAAADAAPADERTAWRCVAAAWSVATEAGAPLAPALRGLATTLRGIARSARDVEVALAGPVATARVVLALPFLGLALAALIGVDALDTLVGTAPGLACLVAGLVLVVAGVRWNARLVAAAARFDPAPGLVFDLLAIALSGGAGVDRARALVERAVADAGLEAEAGADEVLAFSRTAGVPAVALLRGEAEERRQRERAAAATRAVRLETRLLAPLGLCILPAFVLLGVAPILLALLSSTAAAL
jgi:tight adherence protein B